MNTTEKKKDSLVAKLRAEFEKARERNWDKIYIFVDLHDTVLGSSYTGTEISKNFFEGAITTLQAFSQRKDIVLVIYTSSKDDHVEQYREMFKVLGIHFMYVNENPEQGNTYYADFSKKPYMNLILDDKAGFEPKRQWKLLHKAIKEIPLLTGPKKQFLIASTVMRIQSPEGPHIGHMALITEMFDRGKRVIIFLACDRSFPSKKNPVSFEVRSKMLQEAIVAAGFGTRNYVVLPLRNQRYNNVWANELEKSIATILQKPDLACDEVALFHSRDGFGRHYIPTGRFPVYEVEEIPGVNATAIRERVLSHSSENVTYAQGLVAQQSKQPAVMLFMQVRAIIKNAAGKIAIVKYASSDERKYRFPGGYMVPKKDVSFTQALVRKLNAKLNMGACEKDFTFLGDVSIPDWRHQEAGIITRGMVYETLVNKTFSVSEDYRGPQIEEIRFVTKKQLVKLIDEEEQEIITLIK